MAKTILEHVVRRIRMAIARAIITTLFLAKEVPKIHAVLTIEFIFQSLRSRADAGKSWPYFRPDPQGHDGQQNAPYHQRDPGAFRNLLERCAPEETYCP